MPFFVCKNYKKEYIMEKTFGNFLQEFVNKSYNELLEIANQAFCLIVEAYDKINPDGEVSDFFLPFIATTIAADGQLTSLELTFLNDVLEGNLAYEEAKSFAQAYYNPEIFEVVDQMIDACGKDLKHALVIFCVCFAAVDETITREETAYLAKLLA